MEDARKEGGRWFCSPSCLLQGSPGRWKKPERSAPARAVRRFVKWTLIVVALTVIAAIVGAILGLGATTKTAAQKGPPKKVRVAPQRGDRARPIPFGRPVRLAGSWRLKVRSVVRDANSLISNRIDPKLHVKDQGPPSPGAQYVMVGVALTYVGGGSGNYTSIEPRIHVMGKHNAPYDDSGCIPPKQILGSGLSETIFSGHTVQGNLCFEVAKNDVKTLRLVVDPIEFSTSHGRRIWFALR